MKIDMTAVKGFMTSKKGKAVVVTVIGGAVLHFFPGAADSVGEIGRYLAEIATAVADKVQPVADTAATVVQTPTP